ncbi:MAG: TonB-dependent receptor, partial [Sphingomonadaceae bacterium]|nr:TonB-dependent receptor [Sphingomonadaceae bacterium]
MSHLFCAGACLGAIITALASAPALAQGAPAGGTSSTDTVAAAPQAGVGDIVVTATRQAASLQKVPLAVTALSTDALTRSNVLNLQNITT